MPPTYTLLTLPPSPLQPRMTGLVLDSGDECTRAVPIVDGRLLHSCMRSSSVAGRHITEMVERSMRRAQGLRGVGGAQGSGAGDR